MKSDIQIAQEAEMLQIAEIAKKLDIEADDLELYGKYKAKLSDDLLERIKDNKNGKLILVTAINPTPHLVNSIRRQLSLFANLLSDHASA